MTILFAYLFYFLTSTIAPLQRRWLSVNKEGENGGQIGFAFRVMLIMALLGAFLPLIEPFNLQGDWWMLAGLSFICGVFGAGYWVTSYVAQKHVDAGITSLVSNLNTPITIVLASLILNEKLSLMQGAGTVLLLIAIFIISKKHHVGKFKFDTYFLMMVASGLLLGVVLVAERALQKITGFSAGTLLSWWTQCLTLGLIAFFTKNKPKHTLKDTVTTGILRFLSALGWVSLVYIVGNLSVVSAVTTFRIVVIFAAAALFLNEREDLPRKIFGSLIAVAGLMMMR